MESLKHIKQLDAILKIISENSTEVPAIPMSTAEIRIKLNRQKIPVQHLYAQLRHLIKDGYISNDRDRLKGITIESASIGFDGKIGNVSSIKLDELDGDFFWLTWEGFVFTDLGGYENEISQSHRLAKKVDKNERQIKFLNKVIGVGTGGLFLIEILKFCTH